MIVVLTMFTLFFRSGERLGERKNAGDTWGEEECKRYLERRMRETWREEKCPSFDRC